MPPRACRAWTARSEAPTSGRENLTDRVDSRLCDLSRGGVGADAFLRGVLQDAVDRVADAGQAIVDHRAGPALFLEAAAVEDAARVDHEVRRVDDAPLRQQVCVRRLLELVVGAAGNDATSKLWNGACVEDSACRARRQHIAFGGERRVG